MSTATPDDDADDWPGELDELGRPSNRPKRRGRDAFRCIFCKGQTFVLDSRQSKPSERRRRRECRHCAARFTTVERVAESPRASVLDEPRESSS